jgi:hypothetical protein
MDIVPTGGTTDGLQNQGFGTFRMAKTHDREPILGDHPGAGGDDPHVIRMARTKMVATKEKMGEVRKPGLNLSPSVNQGLRLFNGQYRPSEKMGTASRDLRPVPIHGGGKYRIQAPRPFGHLDHERVRGSPIGSVIHPDLPWHEARYP